MKLSGVVYCISHQVGLEWILWFYSLVSLPPNLYLDLQIHAYYYYYFHGMALIDHACCDDMHAWWHICDDVAEILNLFLSTIVHRPLPLYFPFQYSLSSSIPIYGSTYATEKKKKLRMKLRQARKEATHASNNHAHIGNFNQN